MTTLPTKFNSKEHYLEFRAAWSAAVNSVKAKSYIENHPVHSSSETIQHRVSGWINAEHHILYNALRNRVLYRGFTPITNKNKLTHGSYFNEGYYLGAWYLINRINLANDVLTMPTEKKKNRILTAFGSMKTKRKTEPNWKKVRITEFLAPFNGTVTIEMLASMEIPEVVSIESNYGKGKTIASKIIEGELDINTMDELYTQMEAA